ncbi:MAG: tail fiber domain-containing protein [Bacteroidales bacterium]|nr:tail fiber domain-containing protein [Bacteroidales bacterium]
MKTKVTFIIVLIFFTGNTIFSQLKVYSTGNIGIDATSPASRFCIGSNGNTYAKAYLYNSSTASDQRTLQVYKAKPNGGWCYGTVSSVEYGETSGLLVGTLSSAYRGSTAYSSGQAFGVYGQSGNATSGYNYAVYGQLIGSNNGAAIFATVPGKGGINVGGMYAGYFRGNVKIENDLWVNSVIETSDINLKKDIRNLESGNLLKLMQLTAIKYKLKTPVELNLFDKSVADTSTVLMSETELNDPLYTQDHIGLSAQDIQKVFPEVVKEDSRGFLGVDYISLIPILIEAIKEQQLKIETLEKKIASLSAIKSK